MNKPTRSKTPDPTGESSIQGTEPKLAFEEPKLTFVEPKLTPRGDLREVTAGFGSFFP